MSRMQRRGGCLKWAAVFLAIVCLLVLLIGGWVSWRMSLKPNIARNFSAEFNKTLEAAPEESAAPLMWEAIGRIRARPTYMDDDQEIEVWGGELPGEAGYEEMLAWLATPELQEALDYWRQAAQRRKLGVELTDAVDPGLAEAFAAAGRPSDVAAPSVNPSMISILLPYLGEMRNAARLLTGDARLAVHEGDPDRAIADVEATVGLAYLAGEHPTIISQLVALALAGQAGDMAMEVLRSAGDSMNGAQLARLDAALADSIGCADMAHGFSGERAMWADMVQRTYSDNGRGGGLMTVEGAWSLDGGLFGAPRVPPTVPEKIGAFAMAVASPGRAEVTEVGEGVYDTATELIAVPMWEFESSPVRTKLGELSTARIGPMSEMLPGLESAILTAKRGEFLAEGARCVVAVHRYHAEHGAWPASLDALVGEFLDAVPLDMYTGEPLQYERTEEGFKLWSVGYDRDNDGGRPAETTRNWDVLGTTQSMVQADPDLDGDLVFWPSEQR